MIATPFNTVLVFSVAAATLAADYSVAAGHEVVTVRDFGARVTGEPTIRPRFRRRSMPLPKAAAPCRLAAARFISPVTNASD